MNKLLKVLEDRKVCFESAYYNPDDTAVPRHIHDIFKRGMPADFRLVGATTRSPNELPPALRSRCMEIYFRALEPEEVAVIAAGAAKRAGFELSQEDARFVGGYASCGRDAVNIVQMAAGVAQMEDRHEILRADVEWVVDTGHYTPRPKQLALKEDTIGSVHGLAVYGSHQGAVMDIEAVAIPGEGHVTVTGIVEEEELGEHGHRLRRKSMARGSAENVVTLLRRMGYDVDGHDIHINFPGGTPVDGPSAGVAMAVAACSALTGQPVDGATALTGEVSVRGDVRPVGGVPSKVEAARRAGLRRVLVPRENYMQRFVGDDVEVVPVDTLEEALALMFAKPAARTLPAGEVETDRLVAQGAEGRPVVRRIVEA
ncbi:MAG: hypothetical protein FWD25_04160 [Clostridia bacterium]|nr:hypothetical protein [Clostridia bacterium]